MAIALTSLREPKPTKVFASFFKKKFFFEKKNQKTFVCLVLLVAGGAKAEESEAARAARWHDVAVAVFGTRPVQDGAGVLKLDAPDRALDAALVPMAVSVAPGVSPKALYLIIDDNPAPVAGVMHFGPAGDPHVLKLRVRVDQYTLVHAVAEMPDGRLLAVAKFVKAAGGCSAPGTENAVAAMARLGRMKLLASDSGTAELLISHPNYNGMQMDPVTRYYTPARYVQSVTVTQGGQNVFSLDGDIALSQDPAIGFGVRGGGKLDVVVKDSTGAVFKGAFAWPQGGS